MISLVSWRGCSRAAAAADAAAAAASVLDGLRIQSAPRAPASAVASYTGSKATTTLKEGALLGATACNSTAQQETPQGLEGAACTSDPTAYVTHDALSEVGTQGGGYRSLAEAAWW